jgi:hypothetical protein
LLAVPFGHFLNLKNPQITMQKYKKPFHKPTFDSAAIKKFPKIGEISLMSSRLAKCLRLSTEVGVKLASKISNASLILHFSVSKDEAWSKCS